MAKTHTPSSVAKGAWTNIGVTEAHHQQRSSSLFVKWTMPFAA
jgi:hypothetical protein